MFGADLERGLDAGDFHADFVVVFWDTLVGGQTSGGFFDAVDADEPTGGFGEEENREDEDQLEEEGDGERDTPLQGAVYFTETEVDPVAERVTQTDTDTVDNNVLATVLGRRTFGLPHGHGGTEHSNTHTEDDSTDGELDEVVRGRLEHLTDDGDDGAEKDGLTSTQPVTEERAGEGSDQSTELEGCDDSTFTGRIMSLEGTGRVDRVDFREDMDPTLQGGQGANTSLVVTEEDEGRNNDEKHLSQAERSSLEHHFEVLEEVDRVPKCFQCVLGRGGGMCRCWPFIP